jgi:hypothetical protein
MEEHIDLQLKDAENIVDFPSEEKTSDNQPG